MNLKDLARSILALLNDLALQPLKQFFLGLNAGDRSILYVLLATAAVLGFLLGKRRTVRGGGHRTFGLGRRRTVRSGAYRSFGAWRFPAFQNSGEALVSRVLLSHFGPPDYHLMNHVTIRMEDGTLSGHVKSGH